MFLFQFVGCLYIFLSPFFLVQNLVTFILYIVLIFLKYQLLILLIILLIYLLLCTSSIFCLNFVNFYIFSLAYLIVAYLPEMEAESLALSNFFFLQQCIFFLSINVAMQQTCLLSVHLFCLFLFPSSLDLAFAFLHLGIQVCYINFFLNILKLPFERHLRMAQSVKHSTLDFLILAQVMMSGL